LYEYAARRFLGWLSAGKLLLSDANPSLIHEYLRFRRLADHRPATLKAFLDRLRAFFRYAVSEKLAADDPTRGVSHLWLDVPAGLPGYQGVLRRVFRKPSHILRFRLPLFAPHWESYLSLRLEQGYSKKGLYHVMEHNAHFHGYLVGKRARNFSQVALRHVEAFLRHKRRRFRQAHGRPMPQGYRKLISGCLMGFLDHAWRHRRQTPSRSKTAKSGAMPDGLLEAYLDFCRDHGGLNSTTTGGYRRELLNLRCFLGRRGILNMREVTAADLDAFLVRRSSSMSPRGLQSAATALRSWLRYLHLHGRIPRDLAGCVISPSRFSADLRPKYLPWHRIEELLAAVDRVSPAGKRDYAILALLACHGLRAREAAGLRIEDIDLDKQSLRLRHRKNGTTADIPISRCAVSALRDYGAVRRDCGRAEFFLTDHAPIAPLSGRSLSGVAQRRLRATFGGRGGAYTLRHSFAKAMLDRGARLHDIGALLGHKSLRNTLIYTRIATEDMREVADNYAAWL
jgi:site-specific recombinase XerD